MFKKRKNVLNKWKRLWVWSVRIVEEVKQVKGKEEERFLFQGAHGLTQKKNLGMRRETGSH